MSYTRSTHSPMRRQDGGSAYGKGSARCRGRRAARGEAESDALLHPERDRDGLRLHRGRVAPEVEIDLAELHPAALRIEKDKAPSTRDGYASTHCAKAARFIIALFLTNVIDPVSRSTTIVKFAEKS